MIDFQLDEQHKLQFDLLLHRDGERRLLVGFEEKVTPPLNSITIFGYLKNEQIDQLVEYLQLRRGGIYNALDDNYNQ